MKITKKLRDWLVANEKVSQEDSTDDAKCAVAVGGAVLDQSLDSSTLVELQKDDDANNGNALIDALKSVQEGQAALLARLEKVEAGGSDYSKATVTDETKAKLPESLGGAAAGGDGAVTEVKVKGAHERYDSTLKAAVYPERWKSGHKHPLAGHQITEQVGGPGSVGQRRNLHLPSELDSAINGAYLKMVISGRCGSKTPRQFRPTEHDIELYNYALENSKWAGIIHGNGSEDENAIAVRNEKLTDFQRKAILDDGTSGGLELAPIAFDDAVIMTPILFGEFFPSVNVVNVTRGRRMEGGSMGNVTLSSGGADGTAIPLFNTASFISAFDTTIFVVNGAIEIGRDFMSDSPIDVAGAVTQQYGEVLLEWLDTQITTGDGTTEPEGIMVASGTTSVSSANGAGGPPTVGDYEGLLFGVAKNFKQRFATNRIMYGANETTYSRARGIAVGGTDARRVFGMNQESYELFDHPYGITESMTNQQIFFGNMGRYRMYRRMGLSIDATTEGKELTLDNLLLITARARFGGQIEDGNAFAVMTDAQS